MSVFCNPALPITVTPVDFQELEKPNGQLGLLFRGEDVPVVVYGVGTTEFCPDLINAPVVATGSVKVVFNDRDASGGLNEPPSYGYRATGTVTLTDGGTAHLSGVVKWVTTGSGEVKVHSQLTLTSRP